MRRAYIRTRELNDGFRGQRGGVGSGYHGDDYELEVGMESHASPEMLALCQLYDEILEYLDLSQSPLAKLLLQQHRECVAELKKQLSASERNLS